MKLGLVLAGGGARGAYQVGAVRRLAELGTPIEAVAGASIGALNGAVVASSPDLTTAALRLEAAWRTVGQLLDASGVSLPERGIESPADLPYLLRLIRSPALDRDFLATILREAVDVDDLRAGLPLWVSVFPSRDVDHRAPEWVFGWLEDVYEGKIRRRAADWLRVSDSPRADTLSTVLASAALPFVMPAQTLGRRRLRDGGIADNAPARPLVTYEQCDILIVVHLRTGVLWDASIFAPAQVLEIRPVESLDSPGYLGGLAGLLDFSGSRIDSLIGRGYADATATLARLERVLGSVRGMRDSRAQMREALEALEDPED
jgi:NTE family protein